MPLDWRVFTGIYELGQTGVSELSQLLRKSPQESFVGLHDYFVPAG